MASSAVGVSEHHIEIEIAGKNKAAAPEKWLNSFVHFITLVEKLGNALGTLAFTWATVVLLGGYPTVLHPNNDFWFATTIVFLEAARMFSRDNNNRLDYQLFFRTRGAFRSLGWNGLVLIICVSNCFVWLLTSSQSLWIPELIIGLILIGPYICLEVSRVLLCSPLQHGISLWSPMFAILLSLLMAPAPYNLDEDSRIRRRNILLMMYLILLAVVLLMTLSRLQFPGIVKLVDSTLGHKLLPWRRVIIRLCMLSTMAMLVLTFDDNGPRVMIILFQVFALVVVSFGNLQIPVAGLRIGLALFRLRDNNYLGDDDQIVPETKINLVPSLNIFYAMVLGQGILYIAACILEVFSFILRRSLVRRAEFRGRMGVEHVNLYYAYAFEKCMRGAVLTPEKISLIRFAMDSLKSESPKMQLHGVQMLHNLLKKEPFKTKAISKLTNSMNTMNSLFNMLGRTSEGDKDIRSYATKVMAEIADSLRIVSIPGAMQLIASLLDTGHRLKIMDPLLDIDSPETKEDTSSQQVGKDKHKFMMLKWWKQMAIYCLIPREDESSRDEPNTYMLRCWKYITKCWSIPKESPSTNQDLLPVLAMSILDKLASFDLENGMEINRATGLISKIVDYTSSRTDMENIDEAQQILLKGSSLKLLRRLAGTKGKFGVTLRQKISEHPFLLSNLAHILDDSCSSQEHKELTAEILRNLAMEGNTRAEIGQIRNIISRLMHAFISKGGPSGTNSEHLLRKITGQALALLAMDNTHNCLVMLAEPEYVFIKELTMMIHSERYKYVAASLLRNMCVHARGQLTSSDLKDLSQILPKVWEGIMDTEGAELEILVGLSSQICNVLPEYFSQELEHDQIKGTFIRRLVNVLNGNAIPTSQCPGIRSVVVEHAIYMMEGNPNCTSCFERCQMMEALLMVERTPSRAEKYRLFLGDAGFMEHNMPLPTLVARAKELMDQGINSVA